MCKLYLRVSARTFDPAPIIQLLQPRMTATQKDGFGFATSKGWAKSAQIDMSVRPIPAAIPRKWRKPEPLQAGAPLARTSWLLAHSRTSTNARGDVNAHPFVGPTSVLAHNGIVEEIGKQEHDHACDSGRMHQWLEAGGLMRDAGTYWEGYGVVIVAQEGVIHIYRDTAPLYWSHSDRTWQFATSEQDIQGAPEHKGAVPNMSHTTIRKCRVITRKWKGFGESLASMSQYGKTNADYLAEVRGRMDTRSRNDKELAAASTSWTQDPVTKEWRAPKAAAGLLDWEGR